ARRDVIASLPRVPENRVSARVERPHDTHRLDRSSGSTSPCPDYRPSNLDPNKRSCRPRKPTTTYKTAPPATKSQAVHSGIRMQLLSPYQTPSAANKDGQKNQRSVYFPSDSGTSRYRAGSSPPPLNGVPSLSPVAQPAFRPT